MGEHLLKSDIILHRLSLGQLKHNTLRGELQLLQETKRLSAFMPGIVQHARMHVDKNKPVSPGFSSGQTFHIPRE
ncbi:hypothetical protein D3C75_957280 [compost metagenome]